MSSRVEIMGDRVIVDGDDLSDKIDGYYLESLDGVTHLALIVSVNDADVTVEASQVSTTMGEQAAREAALAILASLDVDELIEEAMEGDLDVSPLHAMMAVIQRKVLNAT